MPDTAMIELTLEEARVKRNKQDRRLQALLRLAAGVLVVVLSVGTVAVSVNRQLAASVAVIVLGSVILLGLNLVSIEVIAHKWRDGPSIARLMSLLQGQQLSFMQFQIVLIRQLRWDYDHNETRLRRVRQFVALQVFIAFLGIFILLLGFYELT